MHTPDQAAQADKALAEWREAFDRWQNYYRDFPVRGGPLAGSGDEVTGLMVRANKLRDDMLQLAQELARAGGHENRNG